MLPVDRHVLQGVKRKGPEMKPCKGSLGTERPEWEAQKRGEPGQEQWGPVERQELPGRGWSDSGVLNYAPVGSQESLSWEEAGRKREGED